MLGIRKYISYPKGAHYPVGKRYINLLVLLIQVHPVYQPIKKVIFLILTCVHPVLKAGLEYTKLLEMGDNDMVPAFEGLIAGSGVK